MEFNLAEQLAILKSVDSVLRADDMIYEGEAIFLSQLASVISFEPELLKKAREVESEEAMAILRAMPANKKHALSVLLNEAATADGRVTDQELQLILGIFEAVGIQVDRL